MSTYAISPPETTRAKRGFGLRATASSAVGFALDFYDLYVVVFVAPVIASVFFPFDNGALALAGAYATLAATLVMRPIGAALLGGLADRHGRKRAMVIGLLGVGLVTAAMGLLPTAAQAGVAAPLALLALRLVQGLFVGGVFASTLTIATESVAPRWRGLASGLVGGGGTAAGSVLASLALLAATRLFPGLEFQEWGWRVMFLIGGLPILLSVVAVRWVEESPMWSPETARRTRPLAILLALPGRRMLLRNIGLVFGIGTHFLLTIGFLPTFLQVVNHVPVGRVAPLLVAVNLLAMCAAPLTGHLSQRFGRRRVMLTVLVGNVILLPLLLWLLSGLRWTGSELPIALPVLLISCLAVAAFGPLPIFLNECFPTPVRASGTALSVNIGFALAGLVPVAVNGLSGSPARIPAFVVGAMVACGLVAVACLAAARDHRDELV
jgi:MFS transporter, MHS family, proline/betaine transporter